MADGSTNFDLGAELVELAAYIPPPAAAPLREVAFRADAWLAEEVTNLRRLFEADTPMDAIAAALGRKIHGVRSKVQELGLRRNSSRPWSDWEEAELLARYGREPASVIAQDLGRGVSAVYVRAQVLGLTDEGHAPYTAWEEAQIRTGYAIGVPVAQIAAMIGRPVPGMVTHAWRALGIRHLNKPADWTEEETARALELAHEGHRYLQIIEILVAEGFPRRTKNGFGQRLRILGYGRGWGRPWTPDEDELVRQTYATGGNLQALASRLGRTSLNDRAKRLGLQGTHPKPNGARQGSPWSEAEEALLRQHYGKLRGKRLAAAVGRPLLACYNRAWALGLKGEFYRAFTPEEDRAIAIAWRQGLGLLDLAHAMGRDQAVVSKYAIRIGYAFSDPARPAAPSRGGRKKTSRPTLEQILALEQPETRRKLPADREARRLALRPRDLRRVRRALNGAHA